MRQSPILPLALALVLAHPVLAEGAPGSVASPWTILALYLAGLTFLLFEFFLVPGFGLPGLVGCGLVATNLFLVFTSHGSTVAWTVLTGQVILGLGLGFVAMKVLPETAIGKAMTHATSLETPTTAPALDPDLWVGRTGEAVEALSPQGTVRLDGEDLPARARGGLVKVGTPIEVVAVEGHTVVVEARKA